MSMENQHITDMYKRYIELLVLIFYFLDEDIESSTTVLIGRKKSGGIHCSQNVVIFFNSARKMTIRTMGE